MIKIRKFNESKENHIDLEKIKSDIDKVNHYYSNLFSYVDELLEYSQYCAFKWNSDYIMVHTIEIGDVVYGFNIYLEDEYYQEIIIVDEIEEIKKLSELSENEFIELYRKYSSLETRKYEKIFDKIEKFKYITQADKYNI